jgi:hypothetical protein
MITMKPPIAFLCMMLLMSKIFSQNTASMKLIVLPAKAKADSIEVLIQVTNVSDSSLNFVKPSVDLVDYHILEFVVFGMKQKDSIYYHSDDLQLDQIITHKKGCDLLKPGERKEYLFSLDRKLFWSKDKDKKFKKISVEISYSNNEIVCRDCDIPLFYGTLMAENVVVYE